jgi:hypothetical protein
MQPPYQEVAPDATTISGSCTRCNHHIRKLHQMQPPYQAVAPAYMSNCEKNSNVPADFGCRLQKIGVRQLILIAGCTKWPSIFGSCAMQLP